MIPALPAVLYLVGALVASIVFPIVAGGGALWLLPVFVWPIVIGAYVADRRLRERAPHDRTH
jgi:hypothetical protein